MSYESLDSSPNPELVLAGKYPKQTDMLGEALHQMDDEGASEAAMAAYRNAYSALSNDDIAEFNKYYGQLIEALRKPESL